MLSVGFEPTHPKAAGFKPATSAGSVRRAWSGRPDSNRCSLGGSQVPETSRPRPHVVVHLQLEGFEPSSTLPPLPFFSGRDLPIVTTIILVTRPELATGVEPVIYSVPRNRVPTPTRPAFTFTYWDSNPQPSGTARKHITLLFVPFRALAFQPGASAVPPPRVTSGVRWLLVESRAGF